MRFDDAELGSKLDSTTSNVYGSLSRHLSNSMKNHFIRIIKSCIDHMEMDMIKNNQY